jgi:hypothetical protein
MIDVPACIRVGGKGVLPRKLILISFFGNISVPGKYTLRFEIDIGGR